MTVFVKPPIPPPANREPLKFAKGATERIAVDVASDIVRSASRHPGASIICNDQGSQYIRLRLAAGDLASQMLMANVFPDGAFHAAFFRTVAGDDGQPENRWSVRIRKAHPSEAGGFIRMLGEQPADHDAQNRTRQATGHANTTAQSAIAQARLGGIADALNSALSRITDTHNRSERHGNHHQGPCCYCSGMDTAADLVRSEMRYYGVQPRSQL